MKHFLISWWQDLKLNFVVIDRFIFRTQLRFYFLGLFILVLFTLQWLFNIDQLIQIVFGASGLSAGERINFLIEGFINIFRYLDDFVPIMMIMIAVLQALSLSLLIGLKYRKSYINQSSSLLVGVFGVGCFACGGSILSPILGFLAVNISVSLADLFSKFLLFISLMLSYISLSKISLITASRHVGK